MEVFIGGQTDSKIFEGASPIVCGKLSTLLINDVLEHTYFPIWPLCTFVSRSEAMNWEFWFQDKIQSENVNDSKQGEKLWKHSKVDWMLVSERDRS